VGPTDHLETVEYWRDLYVTAVEVGQEKITAIRSLHSSRDVSAWDGYGRRVCAECHQTWPCATIKALAGVAPCRYCGDTGIIGAESNPGRSHCSECETGRALIAKHKAVGPIPIRWEYLWERWDLWPSLAQADTRMGNLGEDGWELVTMWDWWDRVRGVGVPWAIFKRPVYDPEGRAIGNMMPEPADLRGDEK
jgi:hypothetical protein